MKFKTIYNKIPVQMKATIAYTIASLLSQGLNFLTIPIFTRMMSTEQMGIVGTYSSWSSILGTVINLSIVSGALNTAFMEFKNDRDRYLGSMVGLYSVSVLLFGAIYYVFRSSFNVILTLSTQLMLVMFAGFFFNPAKELWTSRKRFEYKYIDFLIVSVLSSILTVGASVVAVVVAKNRGVEDLATVRLTVAGIVSCLCSLPFYIYLLIKGKGPYNKNYWKYALILNTPMIIHGLSKHILDASDRLMISRMVGKSAVGIYSVLHSISSLSIIVWTAINASLVPYIFHSIESKETKKVNSLSTVLLIIYGAACIFLSLIAPEIVRVLATEEYYGAIYIMPPIASGIFLTSAYSLFSTVILYYKKTKYIMYGTAGAAILNVILNYIFIQIVGYFAAAYTTLIAYIVLTLLQFVFMKKCSDIRIYDGKIITLYCAAVVLGCLACIPLYRTTVIRYIIIAGILIVGYVKRKYIISLYRQMREK